MIASSRAFNRQYTMITSTKNKGLTMKQKILFSMLLTITNFALVYSTNKQEEPLEFVVVITSYNNEKYCEKNLETIVTQELESPFEVIFINDCSTDKTLQLVNNYINEHDIKPPVKIIDNKIRVGYSLENVYNTVHQCPDHKIIIQVDGDDYLVPGALARVEKEYKDKNTWLTYGQFRFYPSETIGFCTKFPQWVIQQNAFRKYFWITTHLKTYKAKLFKKIKKEDLLYKGQFYSMAADMAMMFPMLEMASKGHIRFIPDVTYLYNHTNPISNHNKDRNLQFKLETSVRSKKPYTALESLE